MERGNGINHPEYFPKIRYQQLIALFKQPFSHNFVLNACYSHSCAPNPDEQQSIALIFIFLLVGFSPSWPND